MIALSGAHLVLPDRIVAPGTLIIESDRIVEIRAGGAPELQEYYVVPGFIDVHVHGVMGTDVLDEGDTVTTIAAKLPRFGVTAFCPTTVACQPDRLRRTLAQVNLLRAEVVGRARGARVLPAHLETNFINAEYRGAHPASCLRVPRGAFAVLDSKGDPGDRVGRPFTAAEILHEIDRAAADIGLVTIAPEIDGGLDLLRWLIARGLRVSLGHSAASYEQAVEAIALGARHAAHLFNRMPPFAHRAPGLAGAVLRADEVAAELICDGFHVHPAVVHTAVSAKRSPRVLAVTDGTAASGLPLGTRARLGGQAITAGRSAAQLDDGTLAGSVATMDRVFRTLIEDVGLSLHDAVTLCSGTAARELGLVGQGELAVGAVADVVVLDRRFSVIRTYVAGELVYRQDNRTPV